MGKQGELTEYEMRFAKARFFRYYSRAMIDPPPRVALREWGFFVFEGDRMHRPVTFMGRDEMQDYLFRKVPRHAYYSTAYYRNPGMPMESPEKGWMGADLIFDLDADEIDSVKNAEYEEQLRLVKEHVIRLYDIFLQEHFGFSDREMTLVFSGGRGYHVHIRSPAVLDMNADERREIMDYVAGSFQNFTEILPRKRIIRKRSVRDEIMLPTRGGGWRGIIAEAYPSLISKLQIMGREESIAMMHDMGIRRDVAERIYAHLFDDGGYRKVLKEGDLSALRTEGEQKGFFMLLEDHVRENYGVHPNIHVTPDTKRLIRLPGSLHGGTGFLVRELKRDELDDFWPSRDAIPDIYSDGKYRVRSEKKVRFSIGGEEYEIDGEAEVPEAAAVFLVLSGRASLVEKV